MRCTITKELVLSLALVHIHREIHAFTFTSTSVRNYSCNPPSSNRSNHDTLRSISSSPSSLTDSYDEVLLQTIRSMKVQEIKSQLDSLNISTANALEKEELVQRLFRARMSNDNADKRDVPVNAKKKKKRRYYDDVVSSVDPVAESSVRNTVQSNNDVSYTLNNDVQSSNFDATIIKAPFRYFSLDSNKQLHDQASQDIFIRPSPGKYVAITIELQSKISLNSVQYTLLVDTACSGIVLSPQAVSRSNGMIQTVKGAASMTTAGGGQGGYDVATWGDRTSTKFIVGGVDVNELEGIGNNRMMNVAAINDIGALPDGLDEGSLYMTKLGIYTVDTMLDGRGPVKLLVDTGAASSFMNWNGVADLGYSSSSQQIETIKDAIGAMGADNLSLKLTHRCVLKRRWNIQARNTASGVYSPGIALRGTEFENGLNVDIGDLPVLDALRSDGAGGILGADLLMMCDVVRFNGLNSVSPRISLIKG
eukprot:scaffold4738_cov61-Cyclotella_meneghiniana.AAC.8